MVRKRHSDDDTLTFLRETELHLVVSPMISMGYWIELWMRARIASLLCGSALRSV